jgi:hypothetical protein
MPQLRHEGEKSFKVCNEVGILHPMLLPDADDVSQQPEGHVAIRSALMLEEEIDHRLLPAPERRAKEQIGVALPQLLIHKRALLQLKLREIELPAPLWITEDGPKKRVVRIDNVMAHFFFPRIIRSIHPVPLRP